MGRDAAIPTEYKGSKFRSILEAKYAAFFDIMSWPWVYEPFELHGWIPDFVLQGKDGDLLVEVKPYKGIPEFLGAIHKAHRAVKRTRWEGELIGFFGYALRHNTTYWKGKPKSVALLGLGIRVGRDRIYGLNGEINFAVSDYDLYSLERGEVTSLMKGLDLPQDDLASYGRMLEEFNTAGSWVQWKGSKDSG